MSAEAQSREHGPLALVLGGGGARGIAHLGVFEVLEREGVRPDLLVGTSIGALGAALYGLEPDAAAVAERVLGYLRSSGFAAYGKGMTGSGEPGFVGRQWLNFKRAAALGIMSFRGGLVNPRRLREAIEGVLPDRNFSDCAVPAHITAFDVLAAKVVVLGSGSLRDAVTASCNLAGFFPPVNRDGCYFCDPSPLASVPVIPAKQAGAARVIAVDIRAEIPPATAAAPAPTGTDVVMRLTAAASIKAGQVDLLEADVIIKPEVGELFWSDFSALDELVAAGRRATLEKMDEIRALVGPPAPPAEAP